MMYLQCWASYLRNVVSKATSYSVFHASLKEMYSNVAKAALYITFFFFSPNWAYSIPNINTNETVKKNRDD